MTPIPLVERLIGWTLRRTREQHPSPRQERLVGGLLRHVHAGERALAYNASAFRGHPATIVLTSPAFTDGTPMPERFAGAGVGENISPPLAWTHLPAETKELVLIMQDPDAPLAVPVVHVLASGIDPHLAGLAEGALLAEAKDPAVTLGRGSFGRIGYAGPRPVRGHGPHRYIFQIAALSRTLNAATGTLDLEHLLQAMEGSVLAYGTLVGLYERS